MNPLARAIPQECFGLPVLFLKPDFNDNFLDKGELPVKPFLDATVLLSMPHFLHQDGPNSSEMLMRRVFETTQDGILLVDFETARIKEANPQLLKLLGYSHKEFLEKNCGKQDHVKWHDWRRRD